MTSKADRKKPSIDPRTPWNRRLMLGLFAFEALISILMLPLAIASTVWMTSSLFTCCVAFVGLVNSLTHIFVIRTRRPIVLGAIVGVGTIWMLMWTALIATSTFLTWAYEGIMEHTIGQILGYTCAPFAVLGSINSITILALSIRALRREKRGIVAAPDGKYPVRTINLGLWKPRRQNYMPKDSDGLQAMPKSSQSISLDSLKGYEGRMEAGIER